MWPVFAGSFAKKGRRCGVGLIALLCEALDGSLLFIAYQPTTLPPLDAGHDNRTQRVMDPKLALIKQPDHETESRLLGLDEEQRNYRRLKGEDEVKCGNRKLTS